MTLTANYEPYEEGGPAMQEPPRPDCVASTALVEFEPRRMPALQLACPAKDGAAQRYRMPLWRDFTGVRS